MRRQTSDPAVEEPNRTLSFLADPEVPPATPQEPVSGRPKTLPPRHHNSLRRKVFAVGALLSLGGAAVGGGFLVNWHDQGRIKKANNAVTTEMNNANATHKMDVANQAIANHLTEVMGLKHLLDVETIDNKPTAIESIDLRNRNAKTYPFTIVNEGKADELLTLPQGPYEGVLKVNGPVTEEQALAKLAASPVE